MVVSELMALLRSSKDRRVVLCQDDVDQWSQSVTTAMKSQKLIVKAKSAKVIICSGCEEACLMPVETVMDFSGKAASFVVCDRRDDINRVAVSSDALQRWQCGLPQLSRLFCALLDLPYDQRFDYGCEYLKLGIVNGLKGRRWISLNTVDLTIEINGISKQVEELLFFNDGHFLIDQTAIDTMINSASAGVSKRYVSSTEVRDKAKRQKQLQYQSWHEEYLKLKKLHPKKSDTWISQQIAKLPVANRKSSSTIRKNMK